jgi:hypothetical protein
MYMKYLSVKPHLVVLGGGRVNYFSDSGGGCIQGMALAANENGGAAESFPNTHVQVRGTR